MLAAQVLADDDQVDAAVALLMEADAFDEALGLILEHAGPFVAQGRMATVLGWIRSLPEAHRHGAQASYWLGYCEMAENPTPALKHFENALHGFVAAGDTRGAFFTAAAAADAIVFQGISLDSLAFWMPALEKYGPTYLDSRTIETDLRVLPGMLAAFVYRETAHPLTAPLADLSEQLLEQPLAASQRILLGSLAYYLLWTGQPGRLDRIMIKIDRLCAVQDAAPATLLRWYGVGVVVQSLRGNIEAALLQARTALVLTQEGHNPLRAKAELLMVLAAVAARDAGLARVHLAEAAAAMDPNNLIDATTYEFQHSLLLMLEENWHPAAQLMEAAVASGRASGWPLREHVALLGLTLTLTRLDDFEGAEAALKTVLTHRFQAACRWHQWLANLIEAYLAERQGDRPRGLHALRSAFALGREYGYNFGPMPYSCGDMMSRLALLALENDIDPSFAVQIIQRFNLPAPASAGPTWPWAVRIHTLGRFGIERDGATPPSARKESRKPLDMLKLVVALGGVSVAVQHLCASLWPDVPGDAARNSFDNTLHRLRKLLGGDQHVQLGAGGLSLNTATCWTDVAALDRCLVRLEGATATSGEPVIMMALLDEAMSLYQGEFLAGEEELPDVLTARNRIRSRFVRLMNILGNRLESSGHQAEAAQVYQRVVEQQPLAEDIYRRLIACLIGMGQPAEAYEVYRRCRQQLSVVLGIRPAPETDALVAGLRNL
jgi:DNA-binding SARP family transcriptional activator